MFRLNHRSIKVTLFSKIHIKIISKISLTYHQIAFIEVRFLSDSTEMHGNPYISPRQGATIL